MPSFRLSNWTRTASTISWGVILWLERVSGFCNKLLAKGNLPSKAVWPLIDRCVSRKLLFRSLIPTDENRGDPMLRLKRKPQISCLNYYGAWAITLIETEVNAFHVSWKGDSVCVDYQEADGNGLTDSRTFTLEKLQQLGLHTRFRRSSRSFWVIIRSSFLESNSPIRSSFRLLRRQINVDVSASIVRKDRQPLLSNKNFNDAI